MQALILVGGLGTRLRGLVSDRPKPMALVNNEPFLQYLISNLKKNNILEIILATGYMSDFIEDYFKDGKELGVKIVYSREKEQLGTGGAIKNAEQYIGTEPFFILNGDTYFDVDFMSMYDAHIKNKSYLTMALRKVENVLRYGAVENDEKGRITKFIEKGVSSNSEYINGGIYIANKKILRLIESDNRVSLEQEVIPRIMKYNGVYGFECNNYFIDIGIPEDYLKFCNDFRGGN